MSKHVNWVRCHRGTGAITGQGTCLEHDLPAQEPKDPSEVLITGIEVDWERDHIEFERGKARRVTGRRFANPAQEAAHQALQAIRQGRGPAD